MLVVPNAMLSNPISSPQGGAVAEVGKGFTSQQPTQSANTPVLSITPSKACVCVPSRHTLANPDTVSVTDPDPVCLGVHQCNVFRSQKPAKFPCENCPKPVQNGPKRLESRFFLAQNFLNLTVQSAKKVRNQSFFRLTANKYALMCTQWPPPWPTVHTASLHGWSTCRCWTR